MNKTLEEIIDRHIERVALEADTDQDEIFNDTKQELKAYLFEGFPEKEDIGEFESEWDVSHDFVLDTVRTFLEEKLK